jgi:hypothetical protein
VLRPLFISKIISAGTALVLVFASMSLSQDKIGTWDENFPTNSARAVSMGLCTVNLIDEESPLNNPGALGIFHLAKLTAFSFPNSTKLLPGIEDKYRLCTFTGSCRIPLISRTRNARHNIGFSLALAYSERTVQNEFYLVSFEGPPIPVRFVYHTTLYTVAAAADFSQFRIGGGYSHKILNSEGFYNGVSPEDTAEYYVHDIGFIVQWLPQGSRGKFLSLPENFQLEFTPSLGYVISNIGRDYNRHNGQIKSWGLSLALNIRRNSLTFLSLNPIFQNDNEKNPPPIGSSGKGNEHLKHWGVELGLLDILYGRIGNRDIDGDSEKTNTWGFGVSLKGVIERFYSGPDFNQKWGNGFLKSLDFRYDYGRATPWAGPAISYMKFSVSI